jgi:hypothetical protein
MDRTYIEHPLPPVFQLAATYLKNPVSVGNEMDICISEFNYKKSVCFYTVTHSEIHKLLTVN